jgi:hypothetical protein
MISRTQQGSAKPLIQVQLDSVLYSAYALAAAAPDAKIKNT